MQINIINSKIRNDYEILIRKRGNFEYSAYCPQLNIMVKGKEHNQVKDQVNELIIRHIESLYIQQPIDNPISNIDNSNIQEMNINTNNEIPNDNFNDNNLDTKIEFTNDLEMSDNIKNEPDIFIDNNLDTNIEIPDDLEISDDINIPDSFDDLNKDNINV